MAQPMPRIRLQSDPRASLSRAAPWWQRSRARAKTPLQTRLRDSPSTARQPAWNPPLVAYLLHLLYEKVPRLHALGVKHLRYLGVEPRLFVVRVAHERHGQAHAAPAVVPPYPAACVIAHVSLPGCKEILAVQACHAERQVEDVRLVRADVQPAQGAAEWRAPRGARLRAGLSPGGRSFPRPSRRESLQPASCSLPRLQAPP